MRQALAEITAECAPGPLAPPKSGGKVATCGECPLGRSRGNQDQRVGKTLKTNQEKTNADRGKNHGKLMRWTISTNPENTNITKVIGRQAARTRNYGTTGS